VHIPLTAKIQVAILLSGYPVDNIDKSKESPNPADQ
jgi:hypothetical protein